MLQVGEAEKELGGPGATNPYARLVDEAEGLDKIEELQNHTNEDIYEKVCTRSPSTASAQHHALCPTHCYFVVLHWSKASPQHISMSVAGRLHHGDLLRCGGW
jgi:Atypical Arm repeat